MAEELVTGAVKEMGQGEDHELTVNEVRAGLSNLQLAPDSLSHVLTTCSLRLLKLNSVAALAGFPQLQHLDISDNFVVELEPLGSLRYLRDLRASGNRISKVLQYFPPRCDIENTMSDGDVLMGSTLRTADLSDNDIDEMESVLHHPFLESVALQSNRIQVISGLQGLRFLRVLDLRNNRIQMISGLDDLPLTSLHLDGNHISLLTGLETLSQLSQLSISDNSISDLSHLSHLSSLVSLDLSGNSVSAIRQVEHLRDLKLLRELSLRGNPVDTQELPFYRMRTLFRLQRLKMLDGEPATAEEKVKAINLHGGEDSELQYRMDMHDKYFSGTEFEDFLPPFQETEPSS